ncbi:PTS transporter subunit EIIC [Vagococcus humatus]|uniref:PTS glucose transporter subunit IIB n=1 Tax=Vagococcus humatus TaxID=1889241 RepID=A0A3S0GDY8_9ENTE|nr:PTS transporter subunit EIIC [Vagococcus humatus]RST89606.1 PTS glucose transporter subunit IIB [Vagococcus humatus]
MNKRFFGFLHKMGRALFLPISMMPIAGLLMGLASVGQTSHWERLQQSGIQQLFVICRGVGSSIFQTLPLLFAISLATGLTNYDKEKMSLLAVVSFFSFHGAIHASLNIQQVLPIPSDMNLRQLGLGTSFGIITLEMGVLSGWIVGLGIVFIQFICSQLKKQFQWRWCENFRLIFIGTILMMTLLGQGMTGVWPSLNGLLVALGLLIGKMGIMGSFVYGIILRTLYIFGIHHVFYLPFWTTSLGGTAEVNGKIVEGFQQIFLAQLETHSAEPFFGQLALFNSGRYIHMLFTLPAMCVALYKSVNPNVKRKKIRSFYLPMLITCLLTGVTEPISFTLLLTSPILFVLEVFFFGLAFLVSAIGQITIGSSFSAGIFEFLMFGVLQGNQRTNYLLVLPLGLAFAIVSYGVTKWLVLFYQLKVPGQTNDSSNPLTSLSVDHDWIETLLIGLGGRENIEELGHCATRLRITLKNPESLNKELLTQTGSKGIIQIGQSLQLIYGPIVGDIYQKMFQELS